MGPDGAVLKFGRFELDLARRELRRDGVPVDLQRTPLRLLLYLAEHRDRAVPRGELLDELWPGSAVTDSSVSNALSQIRVAVDDDGSSQRVIRTERGRGLRFVAVAPAPLAFDATRRQRTRWLGGIAALVLLAGLAAWWLARDPALPPIRSVAVLPLENLSGDPDQEYVADGMTDALIGELAKIASVRVISRPSVMRYRGSAKSVPEIASELGVEALIVGSVVREEERIRINLQLVDGRSDTHLWAKSYERDLGSMLALQGEVARAVATQMRVELTPDERSRLTASRTVDPEAYDSYMRAIGIIAGSDILRVADWGPGAIAHLERAVELDPDFAEAQVALAYEHVNRTLYDWSARDAPEKARAAAQRALELDDSLGRAHAAFGYVLRFHDWDFAGAGRALEKAIELSPNDPGVLDSYAVHLSEVEGRTREAVAFSARAESLAPFSPFLRIQHGNVLCWDGQYERALEQYERVRELLPGFANGSEFYCSVQLGRLDEAYRSWIANPGFGVLNREARERAWSDGGWEGAVRAWFEAAVQRDDINPAIIAMICAWNGEVDEAFAWLERAYRARDPMITNLKSMYFTQLRSDPRYDDLLRRVGLPRT